ncbi:MAG: adenosine deaminase [Anaerolineae bacterium]
MSLTTPRSLGALPKIELHRHLEGSLRLSTLVELSSECDLPLPRTAEALRPLVQVVEGEPRSWDVFLSKFRTLRQFYLSEAIVRRLVREAVADAAVDEVRYLELRFTPVALANALSAPFASVIAWVCEESAAEAARHGIETRLIVSINRQEGHELGASVFDAAFDFTGQGVVAVDLAGREPDVDILPFGPLFERARSHGLGVTIHAGEWVGPESVRAALEVFAPERIGHGVRAAEDRALVRHLAHLGTVLEVCPSSNVDSGVTPTFAQHPLPMLLHAGVRVTLNTDDPGISNLTLSEEFTRVREGLPVTDDDMNRMTVTAAEAAFLPAEQRHALVTAFRDRWME